LSASLIVYEISMLDAWLDAHFLNEGSAACSMRTDDAVRESHDFAARPSQYAKFSRGGGSPFWGPTTGSTQAGG